MYSDWRGVFYPEGLPRHKWIEFYSEHFNAVEINSSFYRLPNPSSVYSYAKRVPDLKFVFKLYRGITHYRNLSEENIIPFLKLKEKMGEQLLDFLAQFPKSFKPSEENLTFLLNLKKNFKELLAVELRNPDWSSLLKEVGGISVVCADFPESLNWLKECRPTKEVSYFRFHGRRKLYRDSYSESEIKELADRILKSGSEKVLAFFNNTSGGNAPLNCLKLKTILFQKLL